ATVRLLLTGFLLLTAGFAIGVFTLKETHGVYLMRDLKIFWSGLVWVGCLGLLVSRWWFAQRGRRLAWGVVGMFGFVLLTFWGSNLLSGIHNPDLHPVPVAGRPLGTAISNAHSRPRTESSHRAGGVAGVVCF